MESRWAILCMLLIFPALLTAALIWIQFQNFSIRSWRQTNGRIVSSRSEAREIRKIEHSAEGTGRRTDFVSQETIETRNFATLAYEFKVDGKTYQGSRVDLGVDSGNFEVAETLRRYPEGKIVQVYYDPGDPSQCILERVDPSKIRSGWFAVLVLVALIFGGVFGVDHFAALARASIPRPEYTPLVVFLAFFALVLVAFARVIGKKGREMRNWKQTAGQIVESAVATTLRKEDRADSYRTTIQTLYVPRVVYKYLVGGDTLEGDNVGAIVSTSTPSGPTKFIARFPVDMKVDVFYNPEAPTESTLNPGVGYAPAVLWALAGAFALAALEIAGLLPHY